MKKILFFLAVLAIPAGAGAVTPEDYYNAGTDLFNNRDFERAVKYFKAAVDERPDYWQAYQSLGTAYYQNGNITAAMMAMEQSLKLHPDNPTLKQFVSKIRREGPWASKGLSGGFIPVLAIFLSILNLVWTGYWSWRNRLYPFRKPANS